jgi:parvulin-like peptidyl-prolyl isomerase
MFVKDKILMERVIDNINKNAATEEAIRKAYDETASLMATEEEFHVRAIVLRVPADATDAAKADVAAKMNAVAERLKKGEDFGVVAREISDDPVGRARGGDLGHLSKLQMGPKFSEVASKLTDGQISDPFETEGGWTIVNVLGRRMRQVPPYEQVKGQVEAYVKGKAQFALVEKLRAEAKIEHPDDKLPETKP